MALLLLIIGRRVRLLRKKVHRRGFFDRCLCFLMIIKCLAYLFLTGSCLSSRDQAATKQLKGKDPAGHRSVRSPGQGQGCKTKARRLCCVDASRLGAGHV
jgi:hypothetical protein